MFLIIADTSFTVKGAQNEDILTEACLCACSLMDTDTCGPESGSWSSCCLTLEARSLKVAVLSRLAERGADGNPISPLAVCKYVGQEKRYSVPTVPQDGSSMTKKNCWRLFFNRKHKQSPHVKASTFSDANAAVLGCVSLTGACFWGFCHTGVSDSSRPVLVCSHVSEHWPTFYNAVLMIGEVSERTFSRLIFVKLHRRLFLVCFTRSETVFTSLARHSGEP